METGKINAACLTAACGAIIILETGLWVALSHYPEGKWPLLAATRILETVTCIGAVIKFGNLSLLGLGQRKWLPAAIKGVHWAVAFAAISLVAFIGVLLIAGINLLPMVRFGMPPATPERIWLLVVGGVIGPVAEEVFFRGIVYGYLRRWGIALALCGSTALFVSLHSGTGFPFNQLVGGLVFGLAYEKSKSLAAPMVIHISGNLAIFTISWILAT